MKTGKNKDKGYRFMKILAVSDTHGDCSRVIDVYQKLAKESPVDVIVHCGDYAADARELQARLGVHVAWVKGNCDGSYGDTDWSILETEAGNFLITHGHMEQVDFSKQNIYYKALRGRFFRSHSQGVVHRNGRCGADESGEFDETSGRQRRYFRPYSYRRGLHMG